jgi:hypothetical protein
MVFRLAPRTIAPALLSCLALACAPVVTGGTDTDGEDEGTGSSSSEESGNADSGSSSETTTTNGDGDSTSGDGDGASGDGDGTSGDGTSGDGDGTSGDGDGTSGDGDGTSGDGDGTSGDGDGTCQPGEPGCPCFPNNTCFAPNQCVNGTCGCEPGIEGCPCFPNDTCFPGLVCDTTGTCTPGGGGNMVDCGPGLACAVGPQAACCWDTYLTEGQPQGECVTGPPDADGCATQEDGSGHETRIECQGAGSCAAGEICCGELYDSPQGQNYMNATCQASCSSFTICVGDQECSGGESCNDSSYLPDGYGFCA